ncbi:MAG: hypothetical protein ACOYWZ_08820 [Bacillota bacterium]
MRRKKSVFTILENQKGIHLPIPNLQSLILLDERFNFMEGGAANSSLTIRDIVFILWVLENQEKDLLNMPEEGRQKEISEKSRQLEASQLMEYSIAINKVMEQAFGQMQKTTTTVSQKKTQI